MPDFCTARAELALDDLGKVLGVRGTFMSNVGAQTNSITPLRKGVEILSGVYDTKAASCRAVATLSHTPPTNPYRSAGRPEAMFVLERLMDLAARECEVDRAELRARNQIGRAHV